MTPGAGGAMRRVRLRLYVAGRSPNSVRATHNLARLCAACLEDDYDLEVVNVLAEPLRALEDGILLTPTLVRLAPGPRVHVVGDLSDEATVRAALGCGDGG